MKCGHEYLVPVAPARSEGVLGICQKCKEKRWLLLPPPPCLNCGVSFEGQRCPECGQAR